jgi:hypothetical protein
VAVALDARALSQRLVERGAQGQAGVLHGVVRPRLQVALHAHVEVEAPVAGHRVEHVVEEADAGFPHALPRSVELEQQADVGLGRLPGDVGAAAHARRSMDSACSGKPSARATAAPAGASRAATPSGSETRAIRRLKVAGDRAEEKRAAPPVGSTWLEPAT